MKSFYIEDWLLKNGVNPLIVILFFVLGITVPLIIVRFRYAKKHHADQNKED